MNASENIGEAIEVLQQLGLKEYEARCFVGLSRLDTGTAKKLSEMTEVPRTRVYDAIRVLEAQGLVQIHHSSPQRFRAVSHEEATETLRDQYEARIDRLHDALDTIDIVEEDDKVPVQQDDEVWTLNRAPPWAESGANDGAVYPLVLLPILMLTRPVGDDVGREALAEGDTTSDGVYDPTAEF